ncbi:MAG: sensor histidine kinase [Solirubrobacterales bacterium]
MRIRGIQPAVVTVAAAATAVIASVPGIGFGFRSPSAHVAIETAAAVVSILSAWLILGRFRVSHLRRDLLLVLGFAALGSAALSSLVELVANGGGRGGAGAVWIPLVLRLCADLTLAGAAFAPAVEIPRRSAGRLVLGYSSFVVVCVAALGSLSGHLATGIDPSISPASSANAVITGSPGLMVVQLAILVTLLVAAVRFTGRAAEEGDELLGWVAVAMTLLAFARVNYILYPSNLSDWVYSGDTFRLAAYLTLLAGALRHIGFYEVALAEAAVLEERGRIARDLHDGLAQDLAYISVRGRELARHDRAVEPLASAAEQALADSRGAILALSRPPGEPLDRSVARLASGLTSRQGVKLTLDLDEVSTHPDVRDALLRITSEAISNSMRHGGASHILVHLSAPDHLQLTIEDDGRGLDLAAIPAAEPGSGIGFGLASMRERVRRLGGRLELSSAGTRGARLEVVVPGTDSEVA